MSGKRESAGKRGASARYWREKDARVVVSAWERSGEGLAGFSRGYGLRPDLVRRGVQRLEASGEAREEDLRFHPVEVVERSGTAEGRGELIEIALGADRTVRVPPGFRAEDLERVLEVLGARC